MKIYKILSSYNYSQPTYIVVDEGLAQAEELFKKHYPGCTIKSAELISEDVINQWAQ